MATVNPIEMQKHLKGVEYPASKQDLLRAAEQNGADGTIRTALEQLPDQEFETPADVSEAIGQSDE
jgi:Protein of unknown function (DUF2795)